MKSEQKDYLKILQEELDLNTQISKDLTNKLRTCKTELSEAHSKLEGKEFEVQELNQKLTKNELRLQELFGQREQAKMLSEELIKKIAEKENLIQELKNDSQKKEKEYLLNTTKIDLLNQEYNEWKDKYNEEVKGYRNEIALLKQKDQENLQNIQSCQRQIQESKGLTESREKEKEKVEIFIRNLTEKAEKAEQRVNELSRTEEALRKKEKSNEEMIYKISSKNDQLEISLAAIEKNYDKSKNTFENELQRISEESMRRVKEQDLKHQAEIESKEEEILKLQSELYSTKVLAERHGKENMTLKGNLKDFLGTKEEGQKLLSEKNKMIRELRAKLSLLDEELNRKVLSFNFEKNSLESTMGDYKDKMDSQDEKVKNLSGLIEELKREKGLLEIHIEKLTKDKTELVEKLENLRTRLQEKYEDLLEENLF